jgi:hypothetical protein
MTMHYFITDPEGKEHEVSTPEEYDNVINALRQKFGEDAEFLVRAELLDLFNAQKDERTAA